MIITTLFFLVSILIISYWMFPIVKDKISKIVLLLLLIFTLLITWRFHVEVIGWFILLLLTNLYLLFYIENYEHFQLFLILEFFIFVITLGGSALLCLPLFPILFFTAMYLLMLILKQRLNFILAMNIFLFTLVFFIVGYHMHSQLMILCHYIFIIFIENMYQFYVQTLDRDTADFQNQVMSHHYEEVKSVYLNMRGWRHDYHNHIQTMKAYLQLKQYTQLESYLNELEADLSSVDQLVKSGNLMMDAILNSKLSLAKEHQIEIHCKAVTPESLCISDIDICVMIGNLMDNAIEACDQIPPDKRRIRVYTDIVHQQFYLSVTNSANENISEDQKRYISEKRGNHGHGMKRVKLTVDKYDGYLNLKNEPGVFVSELMIPLN